MTAAYMPAAGARATGRAAPARASAPAPASPPAPGRSRRRVALPLMAAIGAAGAMLPALPARAAETILFNCFFPPQHYVCKDFLPEMGKRIADATEGRVKLRVPPKTLAAPPEQLAAVRSGVMDGAIQFNGFLAAEVPGIQFSMLPFVGVERAAPASVALWRTYQQFFGDKNELGDAVLLSTLAMNGGDLYSVTPQPLSSRADLARRKIWSVAGPTAQAMNATGASVVSGPVVQMLEIVSRGVVDGFVGPPQSEVTQYQLTDYTKSVTVFPDKVFQAGFSLYMSRAKWDAIAPADREAMKAALGEDFAGWMGARQDAIFDAAHTQLETAGVSFVPGDAAFLTDLKSVGQAQIDAWIAQVAPLGVDGAQVIAAYRAAIADAPARGMAPPAAGSAQTTAPASSARPAPAMAPAPDAAPATPAAAAGPAAAAPPMSAPTPAPAPAPAP